MGCYFWSIEGIRKGYLFRQNWYIKGARPRSGAYSCKTMLSTPRGGSLLYDNDGDARRLAYGKNCGF